MQLMWAKIEDSMTVTVRHATQASILDRVAPGQGKRLDATGRQDYVAFCGG